MYSAIGQPDKSWTTTSNISICITALREERRVTSTFHKNKMILPAPLSTVVTQDDYNAKMLMLHEKLAIFEKTMAKPYLRIIEFLFDLILILLVGFRLIFAVQTNNPSKHYIAYGFIFLLSLPVVKYFVFSWIMETNLKKLEGNLEEIFERWIPEVETQLRVKICENKIGRFLIPVCGKRVRVDVVFHVPLENITNLRKLESETEAHFESMDLGLFEPLDSEIEPPIDVYFTRRSFGLNDTDTL